MKENKIGKLGFTLVELMVVMALIAVLATLIIGAIRLASNTAKETVHRSNSKAIQTALEGNYAKYRRYCFDSTQTNKGKEIACATTNGDIDASGATRVSLVTAKTSLGIDISETSECTGTGTYDGGGFAHVEAAKYWIRPLDAACTLPFVGTAINAAFDQNNDIRVGY